jgi:hypothetical protein
MAYGYHGLSIVMKKAGEIQTHIEDIAGGGIREAQTAIILAHQKTEKHMYVFYSIPITQFNIRFFPQKVYTLLLDRTILSHFILPTKKDIYIYIYLVT